MQSLVRWEAGACDSCTHTARAGRRTHSLVGPCLTPPTCSRLPGAQYDMYPPACQRRPLPPQPSTAIVPVPREPL